MQKYSEFAPTPFDHAGAFLDDRQDWLVLPVTRTRDGGPLEESNFEAALALVGGEGRDCELHRFGHWGPGWFEVIIVRPGSAAELAARGVSERLDDYPVLDDDDYYAREHDDAVESWRMWACRDWFGEIERAYDLSDAACDLLSEWDSDDALDTYTALARDPYFAEGSGVRFPSLAQAAGDLGRENVARLLRALRRGEDRPRAAKRAQYYA